MDIAKRMFLEMLLEPTTSIKAYEQSSSSSSSSSDDDAEDRVSQTKVKDYVDSVVNQYSRNDFKYHFRIERTTIEELIELYGAQVVPRLGGRSHVKPEKAVLLTIWYLANMETFRQVADRFNVTLSCAHNIVKNVNEFLVSVVSKEYIKWPNQASARAESLAFSSMGGIQNILGAIGSSHVRINKPQLPQEDYCNRKGYHSVILQGVVNSNLEFINVHVGEAGSMDDARAFRRSTLYRKALADPNRLFYGKYKLLGDSAYPALPWLVTPVEDNGHLTEEERSFNLEHASTRIAVENAFAHLKGRFRRLQKFYNFRVTFIIRCITAACVLHNICQRKNDHMDEVFVDDNEAIKD